MLEKDLEKYARTKIEDKGGMLLKFTSSVVGVPDRILIHKHEIVFLEFKNGAAKELSPVQKYRMSEMQKAGANVAVVRTKQQFDDVLAVIDRLSTRKALNL